MKLKEAQQDLQKCERVYRKDKQASDAQPRSFLHFWSYAVAADRLDRARRIIEPVSGVLKIHAQCNKDAEGLGD